jgi:CheY-like chemotaxis protein
MKHSIVVLEDNADRIAVMDDCLSDKFPFFERRFFRTAPAAIAWLSNNLSQVVCVSLDHDLEPEAAHDPDPGTGRDVVDVLAASHPICPVIIHTTNRPAADGMEMALADAGWSVQRIMPYGDCQWIAEAWLPIVRQAIVRSATPAESQSAGADSTAHIALNRQAC